MPSYFAPDAENTASLYYMNAFCGEAESRNIHAIRRNEIQNHPFYIRWGIDTCTYEKKHVSLQGKETEIILQTLFITWVRYKKTILNNQKADRSIEEFRKFLEDITETLDENKQYRIALRYKKIAIVKKQPVVFYFEKEQENCQIVKLSNCKIVK